MSTKWICSQLGAREKYAIPRAIALQGKLAAFYTDIWMEPPSLPGKMSRHLGGRYHPDLQDANVTHFTRRIFARKVRERLTGRAAPTDVLYDNILQHTLLRHRQKGPIAFFGYSYSSRLGMQAAKQLGYRTILGQINPGPAEADIVVEAFRQYNNGIHKANVPDERYWERWREEISYADKLLVNSEWSLQLLGKAGVPAEKCAVVPLAYDPPAITPPRPRKIFNAQSPLRLLFLGGIGIRKGFHFLTEAMRLLAAQPVHLDVVGSLKGPRELVSDLPSNITYHGLAAGSEVGRYYESADLFVFPTLSDGFGLTQLEAQSYRLPLITSKCCAKVVTDGLNGLVIDPVNALTIRDAVIRVLDEPQLLETFSANAVDMEDYSLEKLSRNLLALE